MCFTHLINVFKLLIEKIFRIRAQPSIRLSFWLLCQGGVSVVSCTPKALYIIRGLRIVILLKLYSLIYSYSFNLGYFEIIRFQIKYILYLNL